ncbi:hypothetical protein H5410_062993 [Solanum commersonii]|uniref:DUF4283 domain-containing protein n=1 Tax=Solanum commersonii TaxID=4109 RepID=A0A9J5WBZ4_SOLCO|nr:hypothetical protein H5410_062993 [Solanum commersonii]
MRDGKFLFEFATRDTAKHVITGDWVRNNNRVQLDWWSPTIATINREIGLSSTWIITVDLPLHLWSQTTFKTIGDFFGGWVKTEEETQLRNHLKWARIKVEGDSSRISKEVKIWNARILFSMQLWTKLQARFTIGEEGESISFYQQSSQIYHESNTAQFLFLSSSNQRPKYNKPQIHPSPAENFKKSKSSKARSPEKDVEGEKALEVLKTSLLNSCKLSRTGKKKLKKRWKIRWGKKKGNKGFSPTPGNSSQNTHKAKPPKKEENLCK